MTDAEVWLQIMVAQTQREVNISHEAAVNWADATLEAFRRRFDSGSTNTKLPPGLCVKCQEYLSCPDKCIACMEPLEKQ